MPAAVVVMVGRRALDEKEKKTLTKKQNANSYAPLLLLGGRNEEVDDDADDVRSEHSLAFAAARALQHNKCFLLKQYLLKVYLEIDKYSCERAGAR